MREQHYQSLFGSVLEGVMVLDGDGRVLFLNEPGRAILGLSSEGIQGRRLPNLRHRALRQDGTPYPFDDYPPIAAVRTGCSVSGAVMGVKRGSTTRWLRINATPLLARGALKRAAVIASFLDISDFRHVQSQLANREAKYRAIFHQTFQFIGLLEPDGRVLEANQTAMKAIGVSEEDVQGQYFWDTPWWSHSASEQDKLKHGVRRAAQGQFIRFETSHPTPDGLMWVDFSLSPVFDENGSVRWLIPEGHDITARKNSELALAEAKAAAESASQSKSQFLATMSHELRTPLNAILGYSEMVREQTFGPLSKDYLDYVGYIHEAGRKLLGVIQEILDIARIETGSIDLLIEPIQLEELSAKLHELAGHHAASKRLDFRISVAPQRHPFRADRRRMIQLLLNLLLNAVKFTPAGGAIGLSVSQPGGGTQFEVWDTGQGIPAEQLRAIWEPFGRSANAYVRMAGDDGAGNGLGLGLTLARHLVEAQGGTILVDSVPDQGSRFTLLFPNV
jgi:PAS domain S-box-containing protein